jgi:hypothetical protein
MNTAFLKYSMEFNYIFSAEDEYLINKFIDNSAQYQN